jgi:hypothetical protein
LADNPAMSATVHFSIKYDGPALAAHQMDVHELAPALIALSELLQQAAKEAYPNDGEVRVNVQGNFKGGSFGVDLIAVQTMAQQLVSLLSGPASTAAANLLSILAGLGLIGGTGGLIGVIKWLNKRKPSSVRTVADKTVFELVEGGVLETFEADLVTGKLYQSRIVRTTLARVVKPLEREGVDVFACGLDGVCQSVVTKADIAAFEFAASAADVLSDTVSTGVLLQIESAAFRDDNKWRFSEGAGPFYAEIADPDFMHRVNAGTERFGKGDVLIVDLRKVQTIASAGLKLEFSITKVHAHKAPLQEPLI